MMWTATIYDDVDIDQAIAKTKVVEKRSGDDGDRDDMDKDDDDSDDVDKDGMDLISDSTARVGPDNALVNHLTLCTREANSNGEEAGASSLFIANLLPYNFLSLDSILAPQ